MRASQKRSSSRSDSDSVGSIIRVLGTGQDMVGAWNLRGVRTEEEEESVGVPKVLETFCNVNGFYSGRVFEFSGIEDEFMGAHAVFVGIQDLVMGCEA